MPGRRPGRIKVVIRAAARTRSRVRPRFRFADGFQPNYQMYDRIDSFDPDFWETTNIVLPDFLTIPGNE